MLKFRNYSRLDADETGTSDEPLFIHGLDCHQVIDTLQASQRGGSAISTFGETTAT
jgi:hypothetical protein